MRVTPRSTILATTLVASLAAATFAGAVAPASAFTGNVTVVTAADFVNAINTADPHSSSSITLGADIDATSYGHLVIPNILINLQGSTLKTLGVTATQLEIEDTSRDGSGEWDADGQPEDEPGIGAVGGVEIDSGTIVATGGGDGAGIGGGGSYQGSTGGFIDIRGGDVTATGAPGESGIGGNSLTTEIDGGTVHAIGTSGAYGIGGLGDDVTTIISGGNVTAVGDGSYAGIGSGSGTGNALSITGGTTTATGGTDADSAIALDGGDAHTTVGPQATVNVDKRIGGPGTVDIAGQVTLTGGANWVVDSATTLRINGGGILKGTGTLSGSYNASVLNSGTIDFGTVLDILDQPDFDHLWVTGRDFRITFNSLPIDGSHATLTSLRLYSNKFDGSGTTLPTLPATATATFAGWSTTPDGSGPFTSATKVTADMILYAVWTPIPAYHVTFQSNSPDSTPSTTTTVTLHTTQFAGSGESIPTVADKNSEIFGGWSTAPDGSGTPLTATTSITADATYYAIWNPVISFKITPSETSVTVGDTVTFTVQGTDADGDTSDQTSFASFSGFGNPPGATNNSVTFIYPGHQVVQVYFPPSQAAPGGYADYVDVLVNAAPAAAPRDFTVASAPELLAALATKSSTTPIGTITLETDIDLSSQSAIDLSGVTLDLAGATLVANGIDATNATIEDTSRDGSGVLLSNGSLYGAPGIATQGGTVITSGTIIATGGFGYPGIGSGGNLSQSTTPIGNFLTVSGGSVTTTGGPLSPGIAAYGTNGIVALTGGTVTAHDGESGTSIDLVTSDTNSLTVGPKATLTVDQVANVAGPIDISGIVTQTGDTTANWFVGYNTALTVHAGGLFTGPGVLEGYGTVDNYGTIDFPVIQDAADNANWGLTFVGHDYRLYFDYVQSFRLYSSKIAGSGAAIPAEPDFGGQIFTGWSAGDPSDRLTASTKIVGDTAFFSSFSPVTSLSVKLTPSTVMAGVPSQVTVTGKDDQGDTSDQTAFAELSSSVPTVSFGQGSVESLVAGTQPVLAVIRLNGDIAAEDEADLTVTPAAAAVLTFVNPASSAARGSTKTFAVTAADVYGNPIGDVTSSTTFTSPGDTVDGHSVTFAGDTGGHTITATYGSVSSQTDVTVTAGVPSSLSFTAPPATVLVGSTHSFPVTGKDAAGDQLGDLTDETTFTSPGNSVSDSGAITFNSTGPTFVTATDGDASRTITLNVVAVPVAALSLATPTSTVTAGDSLAFTVTGTDADSNPLSGVSAASVLSSDVPSDVITNKSIAFTAAGQHTITATDGTVTTTLVITVVPGAAHYVLLPNSSTALAYTSRTFSVERVDNYGNVIDTVTSGVKISSSWKDDKVSGFVVKFGSTGTRIITANIGTTALYLQVTVARDDAGVTLTAPATQTAGKSTSVHVTLTAGDSAAVAKGTIRVYYGTRYVTATVTSASGVTVTIPAIKKAGSYPLQVTYHGSTLYKPLTALPQAFVVVPAAVSKLVFDSSSTKTTVGTHTVAVDTVDAYGNIIEYDAAVTLTGTGPWTVTSPGSVTFSATGKATITATLGSRKVSKKFTIAKAPLL